MRHLLGLALPMFLFIMSCSTKKFEGVISYPAPLPDSTPLVFLPGRVSKEGLDFNAAFSRDGKTFYFCRSIKGKYIIMESVFDGTNWSVPQSSLLFDTVYSNADPFFTPDGTIYFISSRPKNSSDTTDDFDIYRMRQEQGHWSGPEYLPEVNSDSTEYYVSLSASGNMYFASDRETNLDIFVSEFKNGNFTVPVNLGSVVNSDAGEHDPFIAPDESFLIFNSDRPGGYGEADLYISRRDGDEWQAPKNMGRPINTATYEYCSNMSPDGKYFFYSSELEIKWIDANALKKY